MELELESIAIEKDEGISAILGHAGFKTVKTSMKPWWVRFHG
jgi:hypothetical protein